MTIFTAGAEAAPQYLVLQLLLVRIIMFSPLIFVFNLATTCLSICINDRDAQQVGTNLGLLISDYSDALAEAFLAPTSLIRQTA